MTLVAVSVPLIVTLLLAAALPIVKLPLLSMVIRDTLLVPSTRGVALLVPTISPFPSHDRISFQPPSVTPYLLTVRTDEWLAMLRLATSDLDWKTATELTPANAFSSVRNVFLSALL